MILLTQPRGRGTLGPGHASFHGGDFFGDLTKLEKQGRRALPRAHDRPATRFTIEKKIETVAQLVGEAAQLREFESRQVGSLVPGPAMTPDVTMNCAGADAMAPGNSADRPSLEIIDLDRRPIRTSPGAIVGF